MAKSQTDEWARACGFLSLGSELDDPDFKKSWLSWITMRKQMRKPATNESIKRQLRKLEEWGKDKAIRSLDNSVLMEWRGLFDPDKAEAVPHRADKGRIRQRNWDHMG